MSQPGRAGSRRGSAALILLLVGSLMAAGCRSGPEAPRGPRAGLEVGLRRGGSWTTFNIRPSRIVGPNASLELKRGEVFGMLNGVPVKITAKGDELTGVAGGRVALDWEQIDGKVEISGVWNDERVHFEITPESLRGQITGTIGSMRQAAWHCQYVLDKVESDGARAGVSICSGMPEQTRLEFPDDVQKWLGRSEIVVGRLALLASAPATISDGDPRFGTRLPL